MYIITCQAPEINGSPGKTLEDRDVFKKLEMFDPPNWSFSAKKKLVTPPLSFYLKNQQRHAQKSNSRLNSFQWGPKLVGHPVFFCSPSSFEFDSQGGKRIGHSITSLQTKQQNLRLLLLHLIPFTLLLLLLLQNNTKKSEQKQYWTPQIYAQGHYNNPFPLDSWTVYMKRCKTDFF